MQVVKIILTILLIALLSFKGMTQEISLGKYVSLSLKDQGTVEFLVLPDNKFEFKEVKSGAVIESSGYFKISANLLLLFKEDPAGSTYKIIEEKLLADRKSSVIDFEVFDAANNYIPFYGAFITLSRKNILKYLILSNENGKCLLNLYNIKKQGVSVGFLGYQKIKIPSNVYLGKSIRLQVLLFQQENLEMDIQENYEIVESSQGSLILRSENGSTIKLKKR